MSLPSFTKANTKAEAEPLIKTGATRRSKVMAAVVGVLCLGATAAVVKTRPGSSLTQQQLSQVKEVTIVKEPERSVPFVSAMVAGNGGYGYFLTGCSKAWPKPFTLCQWKQGECDDFLFLKDGTTPHLEHQYGINPPVSEWPVNYGGAFFLLRKCKYPASEVSKCMEGDPMAWHVDDGYGSLNSGDVVALVSSQTLQALDCAGAPGGWMHGCSMQQFPPPAGHWGTPMKLDLDLTYRLPEQQAKVRYGPGNGIYQTDTVYFTLLKADYTWDEDARLSCTEHACDRVQLSSKCPDDFPFLSRTDSRLCFKEPSHTNHPKFEKSPRELCMEWCALPGQEWEDNGCTYREGFGEGVRPNNGVCGPRAEKHTFKFMSAFFREVSPWEGL